jgi:hypothetical protein
MDQFREDLKELREKLVEIQEDFLIDTKQSYNQN